MTVKPNRDTKKPEVASRPTKCKHYYFYYNDEEFGWIFLKEQTWFPYNIQIYRNGRSLQAPAQNGKTISSVEWVPMGKVPKKEMMAVYAPKEVGKRRYSGFNLLSVETVLVLKTIACGDFILNGFYNKSLRRRVCKNSEDKKAN